MSNSEYAKAKEKALCYLDMREHSCEELYKKLLRNFTAQTSADVIAEMQTLDFCNDLRFASRYILSLRNKNKSNRAIIYALQQKGIDKNTIENALYELEMQDSPGSDAEACFALLQKKYRTKLEKGDTNKVIAALARRGFRYGDIKTALQRIGDEVADFIE